ncbi:beta-propeller domain-containing protein, methanol dehydrogenase [Phormidesmis priestleyi ULC007]|uniref:Beta-propeller domain-containing protein, methanol dehydrogenase n=1 Tax=Phormidesmis priestleyi ULC007 TaxID=1920490 RepID=A0A2T1DIY0_9CYAN|nr:TPM domain-containing protein [Phormidesmis priestleyi]PSB20432.1 beta-propeller domain-containing protein, methanol dehydrogenase [Phormidesmis priestleyi ULC007]PZO50207.1 MAG: beta-propeller domain-containing protein, methanol dehydrogenase [Phormidesmis priestleyi]
MRKLLSALGNRWVLTIVALILTTQLVVAPALATSLYEVPGIPTDSQVLDLANILSRFSEGKITESFTDLKAKTGQEVRFVTIRGLDYDETIESFTEKLFKQWFPTPDAQANQTLMVLDKLTNNSAIYAGEKARAIMPDAIAQSVAQETLQVPLKIGERYNQGFLDASDRLVAVLSGQEDPGPPVVKDNVQVEGTFATPEETQESNATVWVIGLLIAATVIPMATYFWYVK